MEITFTKNDKLFGKEGAYVSEFQVTSDFNLHVERKKGGRFLVYQKTVQDGKYDIVDGVDVYRHKDTIDIDMSALVYPKYIRVVSESEVTYAEVVTDGEVSIGGGASGGSSDWHYFKLPEGLDRASWPKIASFSFLAKGRTGSDVIISTTFTAANDYFQVENFTLLMIAVDYSSKVLVGDKFMTIEEFLAEPNDLLGGAILLDMWLSIGITEVTEEEFYSLK